MLFAALLALPVISWSQEKEVRVEKPATTPASLAVHSDTVRDILRSAAREHSADEDANPSEIPAPRLQVRFKADERVDHVDCDLLQCYAYAKDGHVVRSASPEDFFGLMPESRTSSDAWLACQDTNDLLSTFERYDRCRGVGLSLTAPWNGGPVGVNAPPRR